MKTALSCRWILRANAVRMFAGLLVAAAFTAVRLPAQTLFVSYVDFPNSFTGYVGQFSLSGGASEAHFISLDSPAGVAVGPDGLLYVATSSSADFGTTAVARYNATTGANVGVFVSHTEGHAEFNNPGALAFGTNGYLYVGDDVNGILVYNSAASLQATLTSASLGRPMALTFDSNGNLFVADDLGNVLKYAGGTFTQVNTASGALGTVNLGGLTVGHDGNLYVSSTTDLFRLNPVTGEVASVQDFGSSTYAHFTPAGLAVGFDGSLYLGGNGNLFGEDDALSADGRVLRLGADGTGSPSAFANLGFGTYPTYMTVAAIPEPSTTALIAGALGLLAAGAHRRKRQKSVAPPA